MAKSNLRRDVAIVLIVKACLVLIAAFTIFGPRQRPHVDDEAVRMQVLDRTLPGVPPGARQ